MYFRPLLLTLSLTLAVNLAQGEEQQWEPSTLKPETIEATHQARIEYYTCLRQELARTDPLQADARHLGDALLERCEPRLQPIATALAAERVPASIANRYLRSIRVPASRFVLQQLMGAQAIAAPPQ